MLVSKHAIERLKERQIDPRDAVECIKGSKKSIQPNGTVRHWHDHMNLCVVVDPKRNMVVTIMRKEWI